MSELLEKQSRRCLGELEAEHFYKLQRSLFLYANSKINLVQNLTHESLRQLDLNKVFELRSYIFNEADTTSFINEFINENPEALTEQDLSIINSWKYFINDSFLAYKEMKDYHIFLHESDDDTKVYAVKSLVSDISEILDMDLPVFTEAILLPFKGAIIYDGFLLQSSYNLYFGSGIRAGFKEAFEQAKIDYGIITSLPFNPQAINAEHRLREMMSSKRNIENYWQKLQQIRFSNKELEVIYQECINKVYSSSRKKDLKSMGIKQCYFAMYDGHLFATAQSKEDLIKNSKTLLSNEKAQHVYYAKL